MGSRWQVSVAEPRWPQGTRVQIERARWICEGIDTRRTQVDREYRFFPGGLNLPVSLPPVTLLSQVRRLSVFGKQDGPQATATQTDEPLLPLYRSVGTQTPPLQRSVGTQAVIDIDSE